jgi:hypothetical protein
MRLSMVLDQGSGLQTTDCWFEIRPQANLEQLA